LTSSNDFRAGGGSWQKKPGDFQAQLEQFSMISRPYGAGMRVLLLLGILAALTVALSVRVQEVAKEFRALQ
jgi:hypothetical protein